MRPWVLVGAIGLLAFATVGILLTFVPKLREKSDVVRCQNNLREISLFAAHHFKPQPTIAPES